VRTSGDFLGTGAEIGLGFTPLGVVVDVNDLRNAIAEGSGWGIAIAVVGFLPFGDFLKGGRKLARAGDDVIDAGGDVSRRLDDTVPNDAPSGHGSTSPEGVDGVAAGEGGPKITKTGDVDTAADALAGGLGGQSSVRIEGFGNREFDVVSDDFVGQTFGPKAAGEVPTFATKPRNFLSKSRRTQIRETIRAAQETGRSPLFEFTGGTPDAAVLDFIKRNAERQGATPTFLFGQ